MRRGYTLIELLVVITIILIVSVIALPTVIYAVRHGQASEGARVLQSALAGARDAAIRDNAPSGFRLLPDPNFLTRQPILLADGSANPLAGQINAAYPLAANRMIPLSVPPSYSEGLASAYPGAVYPVSVIGVTQALVLEEQVADPSTGAPNPPTSWFWNIRVGDQVQVNNAGPWYTVAGPLVVPPQGVTIANVFYANPERFVNVGPPGAVSPLQRGAANPEFLLLVNGHDDNGNGWVDEGMDGVDNNNNGLTDEQIEWEPEAWRGSISAELLNQRYTIRRRPAPATNARSIDLPSNIVVDLTTWSTTHERSRLPVDLYAGSVDLVVNPDGTVVLQTLYGVPTSIGMAGAFAHFWLAERSDVSTPVGTTAPTLPTPAGEWRLVTQFTRTGNLVITDNPTITDPFGYAQRGGR